MSLSDVMLLPNLLSLCVTVYVLCMPRIAYSDCFGCASVVVIYISGRCSEVSEAYLLVLPWTLFTL